MEKKLSRAEQKARRPNEILDAAFEEFVEKGYAATRVEDVAARLGVTKGTVYLYFPTKDALFEATMGHVSAPFEDFRASINALSGSHSDRLRQLLLLGYDKLSSDWKTRELLRLQLAEGSRFPNIIDRHHGEFIAPLLDAVRTLIEQGVASGEFRQGATATVPEVVVSSAIHLTIWKLMFAERNPINEATFIEAHIDLVLNGLLASPR